jgi:hypothetical protein
LGFKELRQISFPCKSAPQFSWALGGFLNEISDLYRIRQNKCLNGGQVMSNKRAIERRKHRRLQGKDGALLSLGSGEEKLWHIIDICECGLAFRYLGQLEDPQRFSELVLLSKDASFCLEKVPFTVITDLEMGGRFLSRYTFRRCGVQFGALTKDQSSHLQNFINKYASTAP